MKEALVILYVITTFNGEPVTGVMDQFETMQECVFVADTMNAYDLSNTVYMCGYERENQ